MSGRTSSEFAISFYIFLLSAIAALVTFFSIISHENYKITLVDEVSTGKINYHILNNQTCVGTLNSDLTAAGDTYSLLVSGKLNLNFGTHIIQPELSSAMGFNSLGQLGDGQFRIKLSDGNLSISTKEIDPIMVEVKADRNGVSRSHKFTIPGPVELRKIDSKTYRIIYSHLHQITASIKQVINVPTGSIFDLSLVKEESNKTVCNSSGTLDLTGTLLAVSQFAKQIGDKFGLQPLIQKELGESK